MRLARYLILTGLMAALLALPGCVGREVDNKDSLLDRNWGSSYESAIYNQTLNPEAGQNTEPVVGLDGQVAEKNMEQYKKEGSAGKKSGATSNIGSSISIK